MAKIYASRSPEISEREINNMNRSRKIASQGMVLLENNGILPLKNVKTIAAYGNGVRKTVKGGTGSGDVNSRMVINIEQGLEDAGFEIVTKDWLDIFDKQCAEAFETYSVAFKKKIEEQGMGAIMDFLENPYKDPDLPEIEEVAKADACVFIISRNSGEGADRHPVAGDYELTEGEKASITKLGEVYDSIVVVLNVGGVIDTKFLRACPKVGAILNMSQAGNISGYALADVLTGKVTPSGHLTTTWAEDYMDYASAPTFSHMNGDTDDEYYNDGIYVGYRYFDTFNIAPAYPIGYGKSYTTFDVKADGVCLEGDQVIVQATVTNTGSEYSGKEVVQVYYSAPVGSLPEKPYQELAGFAKTGELAPGASETLTITFPVQFMASYCEKCASWVLAPGTYYVRVGVHSRATHIAAAITLAERTVTSVLQNKAVLDGELEPIHPTGYMYTYEGEVEEMAAAPVLVLDPAVIKTETITYSAAPEEMTTDKDWTITLDDVIEGKADLKELVAQLTVEEMADLCIGTARGGGFGGPQVGNSSTAVPGAAGDTTSKLIESRKVPNITLPDGPAGLRLATHFVTDANDNIIPGLGETGFGGLLDFGRPKPERPEDAKDYYQYCTAIPIATLLAQTWDLKAIEDAGDIVGSEMEEFHANLWLAPGMNIHRNPLCGRNFEYYSEDPLVAGRCAAADTKGVQKHPGCGTCIKHYALNSQEDNRQGNNAHVSERAIREIYVKGFEIAVKESQPLSLMTSYNLINGEHAANKYDTVTAMLRDEWGFNGLVMTDWGTTGGEGFFGEEPPKRKYEDADAAGCIKAGNDLTMPGGEHDLQSIINSVGAQEGEARYPITKAELQLCSWRILNIIKKIVVDTRA
ncbi:MAG: glycoside hydrolase family 3 C-terminal domain-containing protein [Firmicutes bacterium]|nr:glycoside hydrolase family 3 C-terminal domain-containing protein [Bacillota bacterium]